MEPRAAKVPRTTCHRRMESSSPPFSPLGRGELPYILVGQQEEDACPRVSGASERGTAQAPQGEDWVEGEGAPGVKTSAPRAEGPGRPPGSQESQLVLPRRVSGR